MALKAAVFAVTCIALASHLRAGAPADEKGKQAAFDAKMKALNDAARKRKPATMPTSMPSRAASPRVVMRLKDGAPDNVRQWFEHRDEMREQAIRDVDARIVRLGEYQSGCRKAIAEIRRRNLPQIDVGRDPLGNRQTRPDPEAVAQQKSDIKVEQANISEAITAVQSMKALAAKMRAEPDGFYFGRFHPTANTFGRILEPCEVIQVVSPTAFRGRLGDVELWFDGLDTSKFADGQTVTLPSALFCPGSKTYPTADGTVRTLMAAEPMDVVPWVIIEP